MWTSLRTSAAGLVAHQRALDVAADNLTKSQVAGAKGQRVSFVELAPELRYLGVPDGEGTVNPEPRESGRGTRTSAILQDLTQGTLGPSGDPMDVAVDGDGFLAVTMPDGGVGYTRGGHLHVDGMGRVLTGNGGELAPGTVVPQGTRDVEIKPDGRIIAVSSEGDRTEIGQFRFVRFENPEGLMQLGNGLLVPSAASGEPIEGEAGDVGVGTVLAGMLEDSNIDSREEYLRVVQAQRAYELNVRALKAVDEMLADANQLRRQ